MGRGFWERSYQNITEETTQLEIKASDPIDSHVVDLRAPSMPRTTGMAVAGHAALGYGVPGDAVA